jgi:hypothetical protein
MNTEDKRNPKNWNKEEVDNVVRVFQWLLEQDKKQNPELYKLPKGVVSDKDGNQVKLQCSSTVEMLH